MQENPSSEAAAGACRWLPFVLATVAVYSPFPLAACGGFSGFSDPLAMTQPANKAAIARILTVAFIACLLLPLLSLGVSLTAPHPGTARACRSS